MTRVGTFGQNQFMLSQLLRTQEQQFQSQTEIATGVKSTTFAGYGRDNTPIIASKTIMSQKQAFIDANSELMTRLEVQNSSLDAITSIADELRQDIIQATGQNSGVGLITKLTDKFESLVGFLNATHGERYIYSGTNDVEKPVNISSVDDLLALVQTSDAFENNNQKLTQKVDDERTMEYGILASEIAEPLLETMRRLFQFENGTLPVGADAYAPAGSFEDPLAENQRNFLISEFQRVLTSIETLRDAEALNGVKLDSLDTLIERQGVDRDFIQAFVAEMTQVNMAEAITNLKADETQLQATVTMTARLNRNSLLNIL